MQTLTFYKDKADKHRWRVKSENGEIVGSSSQGFASKQMAELNAHLLYAGLDKAANAGLI